MRLERIASNWSDTGSLLQTKNENGSNELVLSFVDPFMARQKGGLSKQNLKRLIQEAGVPCVLNFSSMSGSYTKYSPVSFILNTIDVLGSLSAAPTDRNDFLNWTVVSF